MRSGKGNTLQMRSSENSKFFLISAFLTIAFCLINADKVTTGSVDFAHHYALSQYLDVHGSVNEGAPSLGEPNLAMNAYPRLASRVVAWLTPPGHSVLATMTTLGLIAFIFQYALLARIQTGALQPIQTTPIFLGIQYVLMAILIFWSGLQLPGEEIIYNYFFTQLIGSIVIFSTVLIAIKLQQESKFWMRIALYAGVLCIVVQIHFSSFIIIGILAGLDVVWRAGCAVAGKSFSKNMRIETAGGLGILSTVLVAVLLSPLTERMKLISGNDGGISIAPYGTYHAVAAFGLVLILISALVGLRHLQKILERPALQHLLSLFIAIGAAVCVTYLLLATGFGGSPYGVKKYQFLLNAGFIALTFTFFALESEKFTVFRRSATLSPAALSALLIGPIALVPLPKFHDRSDLLAIERALKDWREMVSYSAGVAGVYLSTGNRLFDYMFSIGVMEAPFEPAGDYFLAPPESTPPKLSQVSTTTVSVDPAIRNKFGACQTDKFGLVETYSSTCIDTLERDSLNNLVFEGWHGPESWGVWANSPSPTIRLECSGAMMRIVLGVQMFFKPGLVDVYAEDEKVWSGEVNAGLTTTETIEIPKARCTNNALILRFQTPEPIAPIDVMDSTDTRKLGLGLLFVKRLPAPEPSLAIEN